MAIEKSKEEEEADYEFDKASRSARVVETTDYSEIMLAMLVWLLVLFAFIRFTPIGEQFRPMLYPALKVMSVPFGGLLFYAIYDNFYDETDESDA